MNSFEAKLSARGLALRRARLQTLQINVGRKCNQACRHCHVDAGPWRTEMIGQEASHRVGEWIRQFKPEIVDLTGGAPPVKSTISGLNCRIHSPTRCEASCPIISVRQGPASTWQ